MKIKTNQIQCMQSELSAEQLDLVAGGGLRGIVYPEDPRDVIKEAQKIAEQFARPFREAGQAISDAVHYVGSKIAGFFGSVF
jgi:hypothetical protein